MPFVLAKTLGKEWDSAALAGSVGNADDRAREPFAKMPPARALQPGMDQGDRIFQALLDNPQGLWVGKAIRTTILPPSARHPEKLKSISRTGRTGQKAGCSQ